MRRFFLTVLTGLTALSAAGDEGADVLFDLNDWQMDTVTNRSVTITPLKLDGVPNRLSVLDKRTRKTDETGVFWSSNMVAGWYQAEVLGPPATTRYFLYVPQTNGVLYAGNLTTNLQHAAVDYVRPSVLEASMSALRNEAMMIRRNIPFGECRICVEGDSLSTGYGGQKPWPSILATNVVGVFLWGTNAAHPGETLLQMTAEYAAEIHPYRPAGGTNTILIIWGGINDLASASWSEVLNRMTSYWAMAKGDGFVVIGSTITDSPNMPIANRMQITRLNREIRRAAAAQIDGLMDAAALIGDNEDPLFYLGDKVHFSSAGAEPLARLAEQAIYAPRSTRATEPGQHTSVSQLTASGDNTSTMVRNTYWMGRLFGQYPFWVSEQINGVATAYGSLYGEFRVHFAATGENLAPVPLLALNESRVRVTTNLWASGLIATNGTVLMSAPGVQDSMIVHSPDKTNWTLLNLYGSGPVFVATNAANGGLQTNSFADFTPSAVSTGTLIVPPLSGLLQSASAAWFSANWYLGHRFQVVVSTRIRYANLAVGTASGNICVGVFRMVGTTAMLVTTTGLIACPTAGWAKLDLGDRVLPPGDYVLLMWCDNTAAKFYHANAGLPMECAKIGTAGLSSAPPTNSFAPNPFLSGRFISGFTLTGK